MSQLNGHDQRALKLGVVPVMMALVLLGATVGAALSWFLMPDLMAASALGGGMMFGAVGVFGYLFASPAVLANENDQNGRDKA